MRSGSVQLGLVWMIERRLAQQAVVASCAREKL
jgi:hypothetical protein